MATEITEIKQIPIDQIVPSPFNTRIEFGDIEGLASSIGRGGLSNRLKVRPIGDKYEIVSGERRFRALQKAGALSVEAIVKEMSDQEVIMEQWEENDQRLDLSDYEKALKLRQMEEKLGLNRQQIALRLNKGEDWVARHLKFLLLEPFVATLQLTKLTVNQSEAILNAPEDLILELVTEIEERFNQDSYIPSAKGIEERIKYFELLKNPFEDKPITLPLKEEERLEEEEFEDEEESIVSQETVEPLGATVPEVKSASVAESKEASPEINDWLTDLFARDFAVEQRLEAHADKMARLFGITQWEATKQLKQFREEYRKTQSSRQPKSPVPPQPITKDIDVAEFVCKHCGKSYIIVHVEPTGEHKLRDKP